MEIIVCKPKEEFVSCYIKQLLNSNFGRKLQMSTTRPPLTQTPFTSSSPTPGLLAFVPTYTPTYPTQQSSIKPTPEIYSTLAALGISALSISDIRPTHGAYMQPSKLTSAAYIQSFSIRLSSAMYIQSPGTRSLSLAFGIKPTFAAYMSPLGTRVLSATYIQQSHIGRLLTTYTQPSGIRALLAAYTIVKGHTQPSSIRPVYTIQNHTSTIFHIIYLSADILPKAKIKAFLTILKDPALTNYSLDININNTVMSFNQVRYSIKRK